MHLYVVSPGLSAVGGSRVPVRLPTEYEGYIERYPAAFPAPFCKVYPYRGSDPRQVDPTGLSLVRPDMTISLSRIPAKAFPLREE